MSIDTREKRAGATALHFMTILPLADSEIALADRQQVIGVYPGIAAQSTTWSWTDVTENNTVTWTADSGTNTVTWTPDSGTTTVTWAEV